MPRSYIHHVVTRKEKNRVSLSQWNPRVGDWVVKDDARAVIAFGERIHPRALRVRRALDADLHHFMLLTQWYVEILYEKRFAEVRRRDEERGVETRRRQETLAIAFPAKRKRSDPSVTALSSTRYASSDSIRGP